MNLIPLNKRVIVRAKEQEKKLFTQSTKEAPIEGEVLTASVDSGLKPGDIILFSLEYGVPTTVSGEELFILRTADIYAKYE